MIANIDPHAQPRIDYIIIALTVEGDSLSTNTTYPDRYSRADALRVLEEIVESMKEREAAEAVEATT